MSQANNSSDVLESLRASLNSIISNLRSEVLGAAALIHAKVNGETTHTRPTIQDVIESLREPCMWTFKNANDGTEGMSSAPFVAANMLEQITEGKINGCDPKATFPDDHDDEAIHAAEKLLRAVDLYDAAAAPGNLEDNLSKAMRSKIKANATALPEKLNEMLQRLGAKRDAQLNTEQASKTHDDTPNAGANKNAESVFKHGPIELAIACARFTQAAGIDSREMDEEDRVQLMHGVDAILNIGHCPDDEQEDELSEGDRNLLSLNQRIPLTKLIAALVLRQGGKLKLSRSEVEDISDSSGVAIGSDGKTMTLIAGDIADRSHADLIHELRSM